MQPINDLFYFTLPGFLIGFASAVLGIGGGFFYFPYFHLVLGWEAATSVATSTAQMPFSLFSAVYQYHRQKSLLIDRSLLLPLVFLIAGALTANTVILLWKRSYWLDTSLSLFYVGFLAWIGVRSLYPTKSPYPVSQKPHCLSVFYLYAIGLISGLLGIGGGTLIVPYYLYHRHRSHSEAVARSVFMIFVFSIISFFYYEINDRLLIDIDAVLYIAAGSILGANLGARWNPRLPGHSFKRFFGLFQILVALTYAIFKWILRPS